MSQRSKVINLYKHLLYLGRDWPQGTDKFRAKCKAAFLKNSTETNPKKITALIAEGRYVVKEIEAMYALKKYRSMKKRYYDE